MIHSSMIMDKNLSVYPIPTGNELNVFSTENIRQVRIMDMTGAVVYEGHHTAYTHGTINIKDLPSATYIVEVSFESNKSSRSVFVKM